MRNAKTAVAWSAVAGGVQIDRTGTSTRRPACRARLQRAAAIGLLALLIGSLVFGLGVHRSPTSVPRHTAVGSGLSALSLSARGPISAVLGAADPSYRVHAQDSGFVGANPAQRLNAHFGPAGVSVSSGGARLDLRLAGIGYGGSIASVAPASPSAHANRVNYAHHGVDEWFTNGPSGLEQGFTIPRPHATGATGSVTLSLALSGNLHPSLHGRSVVFIRGGRAALAYRDLAVRDARGHVLRSWFGLRSGRLLIHVDARGAAYPLRVDPFVQEAELVSGGPGDELGYSVAISGDTVAVGAPDTTVSGDGGAGSVFVFDKSNWQWEATLTSSTPVLDAQLGHSVAISGSTIVAGAPRPTGTGTAYLFSEPAGGWSSETETAKLYPSDGTTDELLGASVAVSSNGTTVAAGAPGRDSNAGGVYVFTEPGGGWADDDTAAELTGAGANSELGASVAISDDGSTVAAGAPLATANSDSQQGLVYVYTEPGGGWSSESNPASLTISNGAAGAELGHSVAISDGTIVAGAIGANSSAGAAFVFTEPAGGWSSENQAAKLTAYGGSLNAGAMLGSSVAIGNAGSTIVAGAPDADANEGAAYAFDEPSTGWTDATETALLAASDGAAGDTFGSSVGLAGDAIVVGAPTATVIVSKDEGLAYAFSARTTSSTTMSCSPSPVTPGQQTTCTVTVAGSDATLTSPVPGGTVQFSSTGAGTFTSGSCVLGSGPKGGATVTSSCSVNYSQSGSGTPAITAKYIGDANYSGSTASAAVPVSKPATTTGVSCSNSDPGVGTKTTCTATVTDTSSAPTTPSGSVSFSSSGATGSFTASSCTLSNGTCSVGFTPSASGSTTITATYGGDATHAGSSGSTTLNGGLPVMFVAEGCGTGGPVEVGQPTTCVVVFQGFPAAAYAPSGAITWSASPSGEGSFSTPTAAESTGALTGNPCSLYSSEPVESEWACAENFTPTVAGPQTLIASYGGDYEFAPGNVQIPLTVVANSTSTSVNCSPNPVGVGVQSMCTVTVTDTGANPLTPVGTVSLSSSDPVGSFTNNSSCFLSGSGASASCSVNYSEPDGGSPTIAASYPGDGAHTASAGSGGLTVNTNPTTTSVNCSPNSVGAGTQTLCTATVADTSSHPVTPTGSVSFTSSDPSGGFTDGSSCTLSGSGASSSCQLSYSQPDGGSPTIGGSYSGDSAHAGSPGSTGLTVNASPTSTSVSCSPNPVAVGVTTTCTVDVTDTSANPSTPSGSISFASTGAGSFSNSASCSLAGSGASASCNLSYSQPSSGSPLITATYGGDAAHNASSGSKSVTVNGNPTSTTVSCSPNPAFTAQMATCTVTVTDTATNPVPPTGLVSFSSSGTGAFTGSPCTLAGTGASATCTASYSQAGSGAPTITARYGGDNAHSGSSGSVALAVANPPANTNSGGSTSSGGLGTGGLGSTLTATLGQVAVVGATSAEVPVTCSSDASAACVVAVVLIVTEKVEDGQIVAVIAAKRGLKTKQVVVGRASATLQPGQSKLIHLALNAAGRRLLKKTHRLRTKLKVSESGQTVSTSKLTFKSKHKKRRA